MLSIDSIYIPAIIIVGIPIVWFVNFMVFRLGIMAAKRIMEGANMDNINGHFHERDGGLKPHYFALVALPGYSLYFMITWSLSFVFRVIGAFGANIAGTIAKK